MQGPASAFATLGLAPGADQAAVDQAYRRLIKQFHPDRSGGDAARAAEINRAYRELRQSSAPYVSEQQYRGTGSGRPPLRRRRRRRTRGRLWPVAVLALAMTLLIQAETILEAAPRWIDSLSGELKPVSSGRRFTGGTSMDAPLTDRAIGEAVLEASRLAHQGEWLELANRSRKCHRSLRGDPNLATLDRCAALDNAAVILDEREGARERGPFSASAVTTRHMTAASILSGDYLAIGERLDRIRTAVDLLLIPPAVPIEQPPNLPSQDQRLEAAPNDAAEAAPVAPAPEDAGAD